MSNSTNTGLGLLAGLATGAILGVLYAPNKGSETRRIIKQNANDASNQLVEEAEDVKHKITDEAHAVRNNLSEKISAKKQTLDEQLELVVSNASYKADDIITSLESKLSALKSKNKKLQKTV